MKTGMCRKLAGTLLQFFFVIIIFMSAGCRDRVAQWDKSSGIDFESFVCTREYAVRNNLVPDSTASDQDTFLVCRMRNRRGQHIYMRLQYSLHKEKQEVEVVDTSLDEARWVTVIKPLQTTFDDQMINSGRKDVVLTIKELMMK